MAPLSVFNKLSPEVTDLIYELVSEGHVHTDDTQVGLRAAVYDSLVSFDQYLREEGAPGTRICKNRREYYRRYHRKGYRPFDFYFDKHNIPPVFALFQKNIDGGIGHPKDWTANFAHDVDNIVALSSLLPYFLQKLDHGSLTPHVWDVASDPSPFLTRTLSTEDVALGIYYYEAVLSQKDHGILLAWRYVAKHRAFFASPLLCSLRTPDCPHALAYRDRTFRIGFLELSILVDSLN